MNENECFQHWHVEAAQKESAAAASNLDWGPGVGEEWRIMAASAFHDDPVANAASWYVIAGGGGPLTIGNGSAMATGVKNQLYSEIQAPAPFILRYGDSIRIVGSAVAAGKKWYINMVRMVKRGVTA